MRINLNQADIIAALTHSLLNRGVLRSNQSITAVFKAGRKGSGVSAVLDVVTIAPEFPGLSGSLGDYEEDHKENQIERPSLSLVSPNTAESVLECPVVPDEEEEQDDEPVEALAESLTTEPEKKPSLFS